jgi:hypothetical protein
MSGVSDLLRQLGLLTASARTPSPAEQLALVWPSAGAVVEGPVLTTAGGLDRATSPRPRVVVLLAPETTLRGLGELVHRRLATIAAPSRPVPDALLLARAVLAYHADELGLTALTGTSGAPVPLMPGWLVGRGVRLPVEVLTSGQQVTDLGRWADLAAGADAAWDTVLDWPPEPLDLPDHDADQVWAQSLLTDQPAPEDAAAVVREALLLNPSREVHRLLALAAALDTTGPARQDAVWTALLGTALSPDELGLLATTVPGAVVLRAAYRRMAARSAQAGHPVAVDQAVAALDAALGIPGTAAVDLASFGPATLPLELPVSEGWGTRPDASGHPARDHNGERRDGRHALVLGRDVHAGRWAAEGAYLGPAYVGTPELAVGAYVAAHQADVEGAADARTLARLEVVAAIAGNEGFLDAVRQRDRGILSVGVQQWSVHVDDELTVLWSELAAAHPDDFDAHLGVYGLRLTQTGTWPGTPEGMPAGATRTVTLSLAGTGPAGTPLPAPDPAPDHPPDRLQLFGGAADPAHPGRFRFDSATWSARTRSAARSSRALQLLELTVAAERFGRIRAEGRTWTVGGSSLTVDRLVTSTQGAAQLLDQHVNAPGHVTPDVATAVASVDVSPATDVGGALTVVWLTAFETAYLDAVRYGAGVVKTDTTSSTGTTLRGRQSRILAQGLATAPGSFAGW